MLPRNAFAAGIGLCWVLALSAADAPPAPSAPSAPATPAAAAAPAAAVLQSAEHGFTIPLPPDWVPVAEEALQDHNKRLKETDAQGTERFVAGAQPKSAGALLTYPYILVSVYPDRTIDPAELQRMLDAEASLREGLKYTQEKLKAVVQDVAIETPRYDPAAQAVWYYTSAETAGSRVRGLTCAKLMNRGYVAISAYCLEHDYPALEPVFRQIMDGASIAPDRVFNRTPVPPPPPPAPPSSRIASGALWGGVIGALIGLLYYLFAARKPAA